MLASLLTTNGQYDIAGEKISCNVNAAERHEVTNLVLLPSLLERADELANWTAPSTTRIRTAAERLTAAADLPPLVPLFGPLWETPGIAILAGDTGVGKSILAVHIAHLVSSSTPELLGLASSSNESVLYYDFELTDRQFAKRFDGFPFSARFIIGDTDPVAEDVGTFTFEHIAADLDRTGARLVILDNITALALKTTADADVSIGIMRGLKRLQNERGVSTLILAHTPKIPPGVPLSLNDLAGSKHLSNFADSVFFISKSAQGPHIRYLKQVKNRTNEEMAGVLVCELGTESGYLGFTLVGPGEEADHLGTRSEERVGKTRKEAVAPLQTILGLLPDLLVTAQPAGQLEKELAQLLDCSDRTIRDRLKEISAPGACYTVNQGGIVCSIEQEGVGRESRYHLRPVDNANA
ncbi:AAA family ATPase [Hymenobacter lucidus]|uniref:AAA family ATPase n=1 Tax=Hymenobacter lucidus TaxID=2880930 RepID=A0ABS8AMZ1_9BACT|nr:AAA family ATPase [Hymenobacter lucidus]MCB2407013.1 AAA family ATPase [Hymenobacter lucidus]